MRCTLFLLMILPAMAFAGAIEDGAPLANNYNLPLRVLEQLSRHKSDELRPQKYIDKQQTYSYYISELEFLGRSSTTAGHRNIFYVSYVRSASYKPENATPARDHHFVLFVTDKGKIEFYGRTDAFRSEVSLQGSVLQIDQNKLDLLTESGMRYVHGASPL